VVDSGPEGIVWSRHYPAGAFLFGSDFPLIAPDRWLADFEAAGFKDDVKPPILKDNAVRLLKLGAAAPAAS